MKPREHSLNLLGVTRSKAKMYEYSIPVEHHINITRNPSHLFPISIALLGDVAADFCRPTADQNILNENLKELRFSALFFDSYIQSHLNEDFDDYLGLLAAATYYLCDLPGSSTAILNRSSFDEVRKGVDLSRFLLWILESNFNSDFNFGEIVCRNEFTELKRRIRNYFSGQSPFEDVLNFATEIRSRVYSLGSPRDLLLTDVSFAVLLLKIRYSSRTLLPQYSNLDIAVWNPLFSRESFIKELWPSQRLLGERGIFRGASGVVQMPTSAGKSKSIELIIRSAFLSGRTNTCVVVAPFRALCREITENLEAAFQDDTVTVNELSDVFQFDFDADTIVQNTSFQILSVTPEKLVYVLRQTPEIASRIGLLVLDEGHQFDSGTRGVTYELLITSLKSLLPVSVQTILISAVISNAEAISTWLLGDGARVVKDSNIASTFRTIGFANWTTPQGQIKYVKPDEITKDEFFVPRVMEKQILAKRPREKKVRVFPQPDDGKTVAAHLGIKLTKNGGVAIFCGVKSTATNLAEEIVEAYSRGYSLEMPRLFSDENELDRLAFLFEKNFGESSVECNAAKYGVLTHHAGIPHGLRLATENALRSGRAKFIICTSTLAQGVNLPIRYLLFTNIYQAGERIRVRDFHNLIGRAGRSGLQTEGTIIFADPDVYDKRFHRKDSWRFRAVQELFDSTRSEPCTSSLLGIFDPILNADKSLRLNVNDSYILDAIERFYDNEDSLNALIADLVRGLGDQKFDEKNLRSQFKYKLKIASSVEGYLISALNGVEGEARLALSSDIAKKTLAYHLASVEQKTLLERLFGVICRNVDGKVPSADKKSSYSRTLIGISEMIEIDTWVEENSGSIILSSDDEDSLFEVLYPIIEKYIDGDTLKKVFPPEERSLIALNWIKGVPYHEILSSLVENESWVQAGSRKYKLAMSHVVEMCDGELAFDGMLILGAVAELLESDREFADTTVPDSIRLLQKRIKYGLPNSLSVRLYELGFSDRIIAQELGTFFEDRHVPNNFMLIEELKNSKEDIREILKLYPSYFSDVLEKISS